MATKRFKEIRELSKVELESRLRETEHELFQARMKKATGQLSDTASVKRFRKDIARIKMLISRMPAEQTLS